MKKWLTFLIASCLLMLAFRNNNSLITGIVTDQKNNPIAGATIAERGSGKTVITDNGGKFSMTTSNENVTLKISAIGYTTATVKAIAGKSLHIRLKSASTQLDEVIV